VPATGEQEHAGTEAVASSSVLALRKLPDIRRQVLRSSGAGKGGDAFDG
jgi:hypothetical protein